jgi:sugar phosphate isomerase/epimerase
MEILFFSSLWGMEHLTLREALTKIKNANFDGVEYGTILEENKTREFVDLTNELDLKIIGQQHKADGATFEEYKNNFIDHLYLLVNQNPMFINSQTGKDYYSFDQNSELISIAEDIQNQTGIPIYHETHRGKFPFCIKDTILYLEKHSNIKFTADFSHFCVVSESFLEEQQANLERIMLHSNHIHARVGHTQSPQVPDPRIELWQYALEKHLSWWDSIVNYQIANKKEVLTITPEFGAEPYMTLVPETNRPIANQWDINVFMMQLLKKRYRSDLVQ